MPNRTLPAIVFFEWGALLAGIALLTLTEVFHPYVWVAAALLIAAFLLRAFRTHRILPRTGLELPAVLFLVSAAIATVASYDRPIAFLQFLRLFSAGVFFAALADSRYIDLKPGSLPAPKSDPSPKTGVQQKLPDFRIARLVASGFTLAAAFLAVYWPLQHDFSQAPAKFASINRLGLFINRFPVSIPGPEIHPNVAAGTLALMAPIAVFLIWEYWRLRELADSPRTQTLYLAAAILAGAAALLLFLALLLTSSRGAWLGLAAAASLVLLAGVQRRWFSKPAQKIGFWGIFLLALLVMGVFLSQSAGLATLLGKIPDPTGSLQDRPRVWAQAMPLIRDYFFTGSGLMSFYWQYPVYGTLGHVGIFAHIHNFLLEIWIEQGILGLVAALWMALVILTWGWRSLDQTTDLAQPGDQTLLGWAGIVSLVVVAVHGIVDVVFYVERTLPLLGLAAGLAALTTPHQPDTSPQASAGRSKTILSQPGKFFRQAWPLLVLFGLLILGLLFFQRPLISRVYANLGALRQAAIELPQYSQSVFGQQTLDQIRQQSDLSQAQAAFQKALHWDSNNRTALQRMASIALARREYPQALAAMQQAWQAGYRDENTRLLYADALVADGQSETAAALVQGISSAEDRLMYQAWYRYTLQNDFTRAIAAWKTVLRINPANQPALQGLENALQRTK